MAATRVPYSNAMAASIVDRLISARADLIRFVAAIEAASNAGADTTALEGGYFGAASTKGAAYRTHLISIRDLLATADAGGYGQNLIDLDNGNAA